MQQGQPVHGPVRMIGNECHTTLLRNAGQVVGIHLQVHAQLLEQNPHEIVAVPVAHLVVHPFQLPQPADLGQQGDPGVAGAHVAGLGQLSRPHDPALLVHLPKLPVPPHGPLAQDGYLHGPSEPRDHFLGPVNASDP